MYYFPRILGIYLSISLAIVTSSTREACVGIVIQTYFGYEYTAALHLRYSNFTLNINLQRIIEKYNKFPSIYELAYEITNFRLTADDIIVMNFAGNLNDEESQR